MLSRVEHEKIFITSGLVKDGHLLQQTAVSTFHTCMIILLYLHFVIVILFKYARS